MNNTDRNKNHPKISVITPSYNSVTYIEQAIKSVLAQGYPDFEHIVVDGGSVDGTVELLKKYPHLRWVSEKDRGQSDAMNKGFKMATGDIIVYLNADDFFEPDVFFDAVDCLNAEKGIYFVAAGCHTVKADGSIYVPAVLPRVSFFEMMQWWKSWFPINPSSYFYYREVQEKVGGFDESDHYMMDYDFLLRASLKFKITVVDKVWGNFRWVEGAKSHDRPAHITRNLCSRKYFSLLSFGEKISYARIYMKEVLMKDGRFALGTAAARLRSFVMDLRGR